MSFMSLQGKAQTLDKQQQSIAIISALASQGDLNNLEDALINGINNGMTVEQIQGIFSIVSSHTSSSSQTASQEVLEKLLKNSHLSTTASSVKESKKKNISEMIFRISEIEVFPEYLEEYKTILEYEALASVKLETGVIAILPMNQNTSPSQFRILEIYSDYNAYQEHLLTSHFKYYKESTLKMVKSLKLVDMDVLNPKILPLIFMKY